MRDKLGRFIKGHEVPEIFKEKIRTKNKGKHFSPKTEFKKGQKGWNKGLKGDKASCWKGGKRVNFEGYVMILKPNHPHVNGIYVFEHRIVIEKQIGRYLTPEEIGHHIGKKTDNRPHMLMCFINQSAHRRFHINPNKVKPSEIIFDGRLL